MPLQIPQKVVFLIKSQYCYFGRVRNPSQLCRSTLKCFRTSVMVIWKLLCDVFWSIKQQNSGDFTFGHLSHISVISATIWEGFNSSLKACLSRSLKSLLSQRSKGSQLNRQAILRWLLILLQWDYRVTPTQIRFGTSCVWDCF